MVPQTRLILIIFESALNIVYLKGPYLLLSVRHVMMLCYQESDRLVWNFVNCCAQLWKSSLLMTENHNKSYLLLNFSLRVSLLFLEGVFLYYHSIPCVEVLLTNITTKKSKTGLMITTTIAMSQSIVLFHWN